ncbi:DUF4269 domain-containing protein [Pseudoteredinibacter isoporae]|uniref:DUF4269 domain-containing protein n=1 Tax=Pseudoteredinibacter isoporae TaxID=570281 RepID=A0A7X0JVF0_9GAMM|nr:DUF4269 domain-containing protein [Pseudoteredinibacter isoporae]MBB6522116.1 hypothetical protein [Pseudoteredinibacter isoporae]NHO87651.1 DUF4269 domain-containing protein [Pseudoteredinibacter isoporae]NIB24018.1 DUF4269 domain-containing protein [Pseudoteredinibacter isoporae]
MDYLIGLKKTIDELSVIDDLAEYDAAVVSTLLLGFHSPESDIDIVCRYEDPQRFAEHLKRLYKSQSGFELRQQEDYCLCRFFFGGFQFEIYGAQTPVHRQNAYRHFQIMRRVKELAGDAFAQKVRLLRAQGLKPEAAICKLLDIDGEPYRAILHLEAKSDQELAALLSQYSSTNSEH